MNSPNSSENDFLKKLTEIVEANITNPQFSVSMLAKEMGMSRSNLHRKVNEITRLTVSQFINQVRLKKAKEILRHTTNTVSEVAYEVGFNNVSYFIKCFHKYYGYSPGEVGNHEERTEELNQFGQRKIKLRTAIISLISFALIVIAFILIFKPFKFQQKKLEKTIAILPAQNWETTDSIAIDGILQNVADNLCKIYDIEKVVSWISVLQYRNSVKPAPEISKELGVNYLLKPRVWMSDGKTYLSITLIEGKRDKTLGIHPYEIDSTNITTVHQQILKDIAKEIDISITASEQINIDKLITSNKTALKHYWEGVEFINHWRLRIGSNNLPNAIKSFEKALDYDSTCASAYAQIARMYYIIDYNAPEAEKTHGEQIYNYAERAYFYDSDLDLSLLAKALYNQHIKNYKLAEMYLKKELGNNPNSYSAIYYLSYLYQETNEYVKLLECAIPVDSNIFFKDNSGDLSLENIYLRIGLAYRYLGFFSESLKYLDKAIEVNPNLIPAKLNKSQVLKDSSGDFHQSKELLLELVQKDSSNRETFRLLAYACYVLRDYPEAAGYYKKMITLGHSLGLDAGRLAVVSINTGDTENVQHYINELYDYANKRDPEGRSYSLIGYYSLQVDIEDAIEQMRIFSTYNTHLYYRLQNLRVDPIYDNLRKSDPEEFQELLTTIENRFDKRRDSIGVILKKKGLL